MIYAQLMDDHAAIAALSADLIRIVDGGGSPDMASVVLGRLAVAIRDHRRAEDAVLATTLRIAAGDRHAVAAVAAMRDLDGLDEEWTFFLYRWCPAAVTAHWRAFGTDVRALMPRIAAELAREGSILYSLALHYDLLAGAD